MKYVNYIDLIRREREKKGEKTTILKGHSLHRPVSMMSFKTIPGYMYPLLGAKILTNRAEPDQTTHIEASDRGLRCLLRT